MTAPLTADVAQMVAELLRYRVAMYGSGWLWAADDVERAADMLTTLAAENATLRNHSRNQLSVMQATGDDYDALENERDTLRTSEAALIARVAELEGALHTISGDIQINSDGEEELSDAAHIARAALTRTGDKP